MQENRIYAAIDLKSFYASVECVERGLDPLSTNLVVADNSRTEKTICLAVSPSLKSYGISGRPRLFEVNQKIKEINKNRVINNNTQSSYNNNELINNQHIKLDYICAVPRMSLYIKYSTRIYNTYLKYIAPEDIHVYSIDEVFIDLTSYLKIYKIDAQTLTMKMIKDVLSITGITATAGIGTNLYLAKVAMDIVAKRIPADENGVRMAFLDEMTYRKELWNHQPLLDFWRVGRGYVKRLESINIKTMGEIARLSLTDENKLYKLFGINAELLIDHAWGYEPTTIKTIKCYKPQSNSIGSGQVLHCAYDYNKTKLIVKEMTDSLVLDLVDKKLVTNQIVLTIGYDIDSLTNKEISSKYTGEITTDYFGRKIPKPSHGTANIDKYTSSTKLIMDAVLKLYEKITNSNLLSKRINITACNIISEEESKKIKQTKQLDIFTNFDTIEKDSIKEEELLSKEKRTQDAILQIKKKFGKNAIIKGMNLEEGATMKDRNVQIGGHKA